MTELDDLDQRLALARLGLSSTLDARARVRGRLAARGAFPPAAASAPERHGASAPPRHGVPMLLSAALMGVSFAAGYWLRDVQTAEPIKARPSVVEPAAPSSGEGSSAPVAPAPMAPSSQPSLSQPFLSQPALAAAAASSPEPGAPRSITKQRRRDESSAPPSALRSPLRHSASAGEPHAPAGSGELALLRRAERAIRAGDPALALILLDQLERAYPASSLGEERSAARVLVECARSGELAKPEAARFLEKHPASVYSDRILRACGLEASDGAESSAEVRSDGH